MRHTLCLAAAAAAFLSGPAFAQGASYPTKPIRLIVPYPPGGPLDIAARALAEQVRPTLGTIVVENKPGAGGNLGVDALAKSAPDGYTLGIGAVATHAINPWLFAKLPYDPIKDFAPITLIAQVPNVLVMSADTAAKLNINSLADLLGYMRKNPGKLNYASGGNGSGGHMAGELMKSMARVYAVHIPYAGASPAQLSLLSGQTDFMFDNLASALPQIRAGKLRALAVTTTQRADSLKDVPTMAEAGGKALAGFDVSTWFGVFAPAGTPAPVVARLNDEFRKALVTPAMRERLAAMGTEPSPNTPEQFARFIAAELAKYRDVVKYSGAKVD
ncbi:MAG: Bug family tripartite tricarboxylate transporter substrate binding protein [Betaproteobacteria bacterium]